MAVSSDYDYDLFVLHNESELNVEPQEEQSAFQVYAAVCCTLIFCISLSGNSFLLWVLLKERAWRTTCDIFLLQLTVSNLCFTVTLPFMASNALHSWVFGEWACGVVRGFYILGMNSYVIILTAVILHCYITVVHASRLSSQAFSKCRVLVCSIVIWLACAVSSIENSVNSRVIDVGFGEVCVVFKSFFMVFFDIYMLIIFFFLLPFIIITFCYIHMWITIKQRKITRQDQPSKLILGITVGYFLCLAPHTLIAFIDTLFILHNYENSEFRHALLHAMFIIYPLAHFYCCLNPLFYIFGAQRFRRHLPGPCNRDGDGSNNDTVAFITQQETAE
ncbi:chemokine XC receptor 1-like [Amphiprion ocellaris]|uniref:G-protein coupled receptors family 1 profile domain-containing protein n=1 Tax=Amphiprion ocellaris TaxID=80972 RepID=A0A3Q1BEQ9_AMPOC|nr:chemokine XC receptor 1-like [Amphiprion ocellaris]